jgi:hypothetical protein
MWAVLHEIRSDYAQIMSVLFLLIAGPGPWSVDAVIARARKTSAQDVAKPMLFADAAYSNSAMHD